MALNDAAQRLFFLGDSGYPLNGLLEERSGAPVIAACPGQPCAGIGSGA